MPEKNVKNRHSGHRVRMRERFRRSGFDNYQPHEVLEQLLFDCLPRVNTNPIGHELIERFGSVMGVLDAPPDELCKVDGIGRKTAEYIASVKPTIERMICEQYRSMGPMNDEMTTFIADWFMRGKRGIIGLIICDMKGVFESFRVLTDMAEELGTDDPADSCDVISSIVGKNKYILVFGEDCNVQRSVAYRILDNTALLGSVMINAYVKNGTTLESLLF